MTKSMNDWWNESHLASGANYLEDVYEEYIEDPTNIADDWKSNFDSFQEAGADKEVPHSVIREYFKQLGQLTVRPTAAAPEFVHDAKQVGVQELINAFRSRGHEHADLDPLKLWEKRQVPDLGLSYHSLSEADFDAIFKIDSSLGSDERKLRDIYNDFSKTYCGSIGAEFMHITDLDQQVWIENRMESVKGLPTYSSEIKKQILEQLSAAEGLEKYIGSKFPGAKRFSLEGGESLIPMLYELVQRAGEAGTKEIVIGMAHRGRLNVLVNLLGKKPSDLFDEFAGKKSPSKGSGDVKYHMGFSADMKTEGGNVHMSLAFNPSHLEIVAPVVQGSVRARADRRDDSEFECILPVNIHGDSAFTGQGVVMETFNMSQARGYTTGGTVHIVINNQVGFTTSNPNDVRSTYYCTDIAKMVQAPIFHVNGDDPEAVFFATQMALDFRNKFKKDVVIDLICYRRHGHNEADEPTATQPVMYKTIKKLPTTRRLYAEKLIAESVIAKTDEKAIQDSYRTALDEGRNVVKNWMPMQEHAFTANWTPYVGQDWDAAYDSTGDIGRLKEIAQRLVDVPEGFKLQSRVAKIVNDRVKMYSGEQALDWGAAENLAYATLVSEGLNVRLSGQDSGRGTFFHRHAVWHEQTTGEAYTALENVEASQGKFDVIDSVLSEEAVLAFEYGYSTTNPRTMVIWEAQFGDFANGAQVVVDQFISSGEFKWGRLSGLTMYLPHGYEGQGPEHSSARLERYMQLCAEHNMQVAVPSTPAQIYHLVRRQMLRPLRRPLVVMTPKSLLRHKLAVSDLDELANGRFQNVIGEVDDLDPKKVTRIIMCSGKVYYDLLEHRRANNIDNVAIFRMEQLYPFPYEELKALLADYAHVDDFVWCQEEPRNQGAWFASQHRFYRCVPDGVKIKFAGREPSASTAAGHLSLHLEQQEQLVKQAFA